MWQWHALRKTNPKRAVDDTVDRRVLEVERVIDHRLSSRSRLQLVPDERDLRRRSERFRSKVRA